MIRSKANVSECIDPLIKRLVNKYFSQIKLVSIGYDSSDESAQVRIEIPTLLLNEYSHLKAQRNHLPDGDEFWRETSLAQKLMKSKSCQQRFGRCDLNDILSQLTGPVQADYVSSRNHGYESLLIKEDEDAFFDEFERQRSN